MYGIIHLSAKRFQNEMKIMKYLNIPELLYFVIIIGLYGVLGWFLANKWLNLWQNISYEDSNTIELCCKLILKIGFWKTFEFQFIFGDLRALEFERVDGMFATFSYIFFALLFFPAPETDPKHHIMKTKYTNSRILRYFIIFI